MRRSVAGVFIVALMATGCSSADQPARTSAATSPSAADARFTAFVRDFLSDMYRRQPSDATALGIHDYDDRLESYSRASVDDAVTSLKAFRGRLGSIDQAALNPGQQLDYELMRRTIDSRLLTLEVIRPWATQPDVYSSGLTSTAYGMIVRRFAPPEERLRRLIARERAMPAVLAEARRNLENPPRIATQIAIEQIDGNRAFFADAVAQAFPEVTDPALRTEFTAANNAVIAALQDYGTWLQHDLLPRSNGVVAIGADAYRRKLAADEMIEVPLDRLLEVAQADLARNSAAFVAVARQIDPAKTPLQVLAAVSKDHPPAAHLLTSTQGELDSIARFMADHHIVSVPAAPPVRVQETPPFMRATITASMETPGPFEKVATEAYYSVTLPDPALSPADLEAYMAGWYYPLITNVSVHEVWPGHYLQFLYTRTIASEARKVFGAASNEEGWAHYCEQMVFDEGFHADDPRYRLAQLQDALLRDVRFIVGIRMHTQGMSVEEAEALFVSAGYQTRASAEAEAKRATSDPTFGYYTMGKLMILKLREDVRAQSAREGAPFSLQAFHDAFMKLGPLPLPLVRKAMLGDTGQPF